MSDIPASNKSGTLPYYAGDFDFDALAEKDDDFAAICDVAKDNQGFDFQDPKVVQQLTKSILKADFGISIQLPDDRLCPPVPVRWNYVHWIQELLDTTSDEYTDRYDPEREVFGLDIGVGASCIYPLLACATRPAWRMAGTDIDWYSLQHAQDNVVANDLDKRIRLQQTKVTDPLIPLDAMGAEQIDFVMTNPPFFDSKEDMQDSYHGKIAPPSAVCTGAENEMICPGGDVGFVTRILEESLKLRERVQWYTAMLGMLTSLQQFVPKLKEHGITNWAVTCLQAGRKTKRWAVAWSFDDYRPRNDVARHGALVLAVLPPPTAQTLSVAGLSAQQLGERLDATVKELAVRWQWRASRLEGLMEAKKDAWSRSARHKEKVRQSREAAGETVINENEEDEVVLAVKMTCVKEAVELRWLKGSDFVMLESFAGFVKRALRERK